MNQSFQSGQKVKLNQPYGFFFFYLGIWIEMTRALLYCIIDERSNNKVHRQALFVSTSQNLWTRFLMYFLYLSLSPLIFLKNLPQNSNRAVPMILDRIQEDSQEGKEEWPSHKFMNHSTLLMEVFSITIPVNKIFQEFSIEKSFNSPKIYIRTP